MARRKNAMVYRLLKATDRRLWKSLGTREGQAVQIAQFFAQKSSFRATKMLAGKGFTA